MIDMLWPVSARPHLSHGGLRVEQQVLEGSLQNPSELGQEAGAVRDGSGARHLHRLLPLDEPS